MAAQEPIQNMEEDTQGETPVEQEVPEEEESGLDSWVKKLSDKGLPVFARTVRDVSGVASRQETSASDLAKAIQQDASMAARLLKVANSPLLNPQKRSIKTISRAVVLMGFNSVRDLAMSLAVVENMLKGKRQERVAQDMAHSFHAAAHSQTFAAKRKDSSPEEVFVASLLLNIGEMAFWSTAREEAAQIEQKVAAGMPAAKAEKEVLGFTIEELTKVLSKEWKLGKLLENALHDEEGDDPRVSNITLGHEVATVVEQYGWKSPQTKKVMQRVAETLYMPLDDVIDLVQENTEEATKIAAGYGVEKISRYIPATQRQIDQKEAEEAAKLEQQSRSSTGDADDTETSSYEHVERDEEGQDPKSAFKEPDPMFQLNTLHKIGEHLEGVPNLNVLLNLVLEGIYQGVGTDRIIFALLSPNREILRAKYALGWDRQKMMQTFVLDVGPKSGNLFRALLDKQKPLWVNDETRPQVEKLITPELEVWTGKSSFFAMPIVVNKKSIGLLYTDRKPSGRQMDEESFSSFKHFGQQIIMGLSYTNKR